jgi:hypothetical protein
LAQTTQLWSGFAYSSLGLVLQHRIRRRFSAGSIDRHELSRSVIVRVIDFAHVFDADGERDDNFLTGVENLTTLFKACLNNRK